MKELRVRWLGPLMLLLVVGCGTPNSSSSDSTTSNGSDGGNTTSALSPACQGVVDALRACDLEPTEALECPSSPSEFEQCVMQCLAQSNCRQLRNEFCLNRPQRSRCEDSCGPQVVCANGLSVPEEYRCDGLNDCLDGTDEADCPDGSIWTCADGAPLRREFVCDGVAECYDDTDEIDCSPNEVFDCGGGDYTSPRRVCDGTRDCASGIDESGCPLLVICN